MLNFVRGIMTAILAFTLMLGASAPRAAAQDAVTVDGLMQRMSEILAGGRDGRARHRRP